LGPGQWYLTKDIASLDATGKLTLIDRVGAVVRTKGGRVLRLGEIETALESLPLVRLCLCHASVQHDGVAAVLLLHAARPSVRTPMAAEIADGPKLKKQQLAAPATSSADLERLQTDRVGWARVLKRLDGANICFGVATDDWTVAAGLLSGEMKKRRTELLAAYESALQALHKGAYT